MRCIEGLIAQVYSILLFSIFIFIYSTDPSGTYLLEPLVNTKLSRLKVMRAATRNNVTNRLFMSTFLVAFSSVALTSVFPCPAHSLDSDSPVEELPQKKSKQQTLAQELHRQQ